jgi:hypothetical protein
MARDILAVGLNFTKKLWQNYCMIDDFMFLPSQ